MSAFRTRAESAAGGLLPGPGRPYSLRRETGGLAPRTRSQGPAVAASCAGRHPFRRLPAARVSELVEPGRVAACRWSIEMFDEITTFSFPTRIVFGSGAVRRLPLALEENGVRKPLVVTDPGLRAAPAFDSVTSALRDAHTPFEVFDGVHGNPIEDDVTRSAAIYRAAGCDGVIGLGGGSAIDVAKAVVVIARHEGRLADL